ncbi:MAG: hypothetical protein R2831_10330 [Chitinophagaceae bacterium]
MAFTTQLKQFLYPIYIPLKNNFLQKKKAKELFNKHQGKAFNHAALSEAPLKIFSTRNEDDIIVRIIASLNIAQGTFLDLGSNDCINSNCANLVFNFDWKGYFVDADQKLLAIGQKNYQLKGKNNVSFIESFIEPENINELLKKNLHETNIDFMNIDIDGNDYAIWNAIDYIKPKIVLVENKIEYGLEDIVIPQNKNFESHEWGASLYSFWKLGFQKGYTLVATNKEGFNAFFILNDWVDNALFKALSMEQIQENRTITASFYSPESILALKNRLKSA